MKAVVNDKYGSTEIFRLLEIDKPSPKDDEVMVKTAASSVNSWDWDIVTGKPYFYRLTSGVLKPKWNIIGADFSGTVEAAGKNVTKFKPGDEVFGDLSENNWGGFAEYVCTKENSLEIKPADISFEEAAAVPQAAVMALQGIRDYGMVEQGQKVLINGAGGGVGTFAVQLAKSAGAEVTGVDKGNKLETVTSIGADYVIDYTREDFTKNNIKYDLILDTSAHHSISGYKRVLKEKGKYVIIGGKLSVIFGCLLLGNVLPKTGDKKFRLLLHKPNKNLIFLADLLEKGEIKPVIDKCFNLNEVPVALDYFSTGNVCGKIVIKTRS